MAAYSHGSASNVLADILLARIPVAERNTAVKDVAAQLTHRSDTATTELVASLLERCPDHDAAESLHRVLMSLVASGEFDSPVRLCLNYPSVRSLVLGHIHDQLRRVVKSLMRRPKGTGFVTDVSPVVSDPDTDSIIREDLEDQISTSLHYLSFLRCLFLQATLEQKIPVSKHLLSSVFILSLCSHIGLGARADETIVPLLNALASNGLEILGRDAESSRELDEDLDKLIGFCTSGLIDSANRRGAKATAFAMWLRWLDMPGERPLRQATIQKEDYWRRLWTILMVGDTEQRKASLHILRKSLAISTESIQNRYLQVLVDENNQINLSVQAQYDRFCIVFETIVLGRYLNQIEECLGDLDALLAPDTAVQPSWLYMLMVPALSNTMQDGIRKTLGNWFMTTNPPLRTAAEDFTALLETSFLPWAVQGQLFTSTLRGDTRCMICEHGVRLSAFFERLFKTSSGKDSTAARTHIAHSILGFLNRNKNRIIPQAITYILQGLVRGLQAGEEPSLGPETLELIVDLSTATAFPEVVRTLHQALCWQLCQLCSGSPTNNPKLARMEDSLGKLSLVRNEQATRLTESEQSETSTRHWRSLQDLTADLDATRDSCLQGKELIAAIRCLTSIVDENSEESLSGSSLLRILQSIWMEFDIQDYPKAAAMLLPGLVFHPSCARLSLADDDLTAFLSRSLLQFLSLIKGKIYVFSPLMTALRSALLAVPKMADKLQLADLIAGIASNPPAPRLDFQLEAAAAQLLSNLRPEYKHLTYDHYYGDFEGIGWAAFFDIVNRLDGLHPTLPRQLFDRMLRKWLDQRPPVPAVVKWKTTEQLQVLLMLSQQLIRNYRPNSANIGLSGYISTKPSSEESWWSRKWLLEHCQALFSILAVEPLPRYRLLMEWMIMRLMIEIPEARNYILELLSTEDHHSNPKYLASGTKLALMTTRLEDSDQAFAITVGTHLVALSASSKVAIRHEAQWSFPILWDHATAQGWTEFTSNVAFVALNNYIRSLERYAEPPGSRDLERLDPVRDHTLANLFAGKYMQLEPPGQVVVTWNDFDQLRTRDGGVKAELRKDWPTGCLPLGPEPARIGTSTAAPPPQQSPNSNTSATAATIATVVSSTAPSALQTKGTAYLITPSPTRPHPLVVVGSLITNATNLGGLSRISEIFGAAELHIPSLSYVAHKDFVSLSVASHHHIPIHALPADGLRGFLTRKKAEGYTVVGVEQTDRSVLLGKEGTMLPRKLVLVMGAEREGVPGEVLSDCDMLVEIPQAGVTRSLNVQTAAGLVLFDYVRQWGK